MGKVIMNKLVFSRHLNDLLIVSHFFKCCGLASSKHATMHEKLHSHNFEPKLSQSTTGSTVDCSLFM